MSYRFLLKARYFQRSQPILSADSNYQQFFTVIDGEKNSGVNTFRLKAFGWIDIETESLPDWHRSITTGLKLANNNIHWSDFNEFDLNVGDIKTVWELSRFDWLLYFAVEFRKTGSRVWLEKANLWLNDWLLHNPINQGINWRCGQEASIRVMHIIASLKLFGCTPTPAVLSLIAQHIVRIAPTRFYAMAQDNNHGTSEACALFVGGSLLLNHDKANSRLYKKWQKQGRYWLENRVNRLIEDDGTFSQYSANYHRVMLDTLCFAEQCRRDFNLTKFSDHFYLKSKAATHWLTAITDKKTGDVPNLGANDGARLFPITACNYRDYRPSVQWANALFSHQFAFPPQGDFQQLVNLLSPESEDLTSADSTYSQLSTELNSQLQMLAVNDVRIFFRTPVSKFRPSSCDALHIDLWLDSCNLLRDAGTYSYNCEPEKQAYYPSTLAHNTAMFDGRDQMPKISRFLYGHWISASYQKENQHSLSASYKDYRHCEHQRKLSLSANQLVIRDTLLNFDSFAQIHWHLIDTNWQLIGNKLVSDFAVITVEGDDKNYQLELVEGWESRYYLAEQKTPVLRITTRAQGSITTMITWS